MQDRDLLSPSRAPAVLAALAMSLSLALGASSAFAQNAADDEENVPLDTKIFRQIMKDIGVYRDGPPIEYRERAPLVVPPTRDLPKPQQEGSAALNPAWPKDPDVAARRKQATAAERAKLKGSAESWVDDSRVLRPNELDRGRAAAKSGPSAPDADEASRPMTPDQLGNKRSLLDTVFNAFTPQKPESATFTNEPERQNMTAPPPGYQTPSPSQPYGIGQRDTRKASTVVDRAVGER